MYKATLTDFSECYGNDIYSFLMFREKLLFITKLQGEREVLVYSNDYLEENFEGILSLNTIFDKRNFLELIRKVKGERKII